MTGALELLDLWPVRVALIGGVVLLLGRVLMLLTRQPVRRAVVGTATVAAALLVIPLSLLPGWLPVGVAVPNPELASAPPVHAPTVEPPTAPEAINNGEFVFLLIPPAEDPGRAESSAKVEAVHTALAPSATVAPTPVASAAEAVSLPIDTTRLVVIVYAGVVGLLLGRLVIGHLTLSRRWKSAQPGPAWADEVFRDMAADTCPRARMRVSSRTGPVCFGVLRPRVLIPAALLSGGDGPALRAVFAHELGHLSRRDPLAGWLLGLARAAYFVWPWLAGLRREVRLAQEHLADAAAAKAAGPADYAELLIRLTRSRPAPLVAAAARGSSSELYRRVTMLLRTKGQVEGRCPRRLALAVGGALTALAVMAAGLTVHPIRAAEPEKKAAERKDAPRPTPKDPFAEMIEKLKKDIGDDPEAAKRLDEMLKALKDGKSATPPAVPAPPAPPLIPQLRAIPLDGGLPEDELLRELLQGQGDLLKQIEQMLGQIQDRGGVMVGPGGIRRLGPIGGGRLGVRVEKPSDVLASQLDLPPGRGLVCVDVPADSPAGKAGVKPNDILLEVAGKPVPNDRDAFVRDLREVKPDSKVDIVVMRRGKKETIKGVTLPEAREPEMPFPGLLELPRLGGLDGPVPVPIAPPAPLPPVGRGAGTVAGPGETVRVEQVNDAFTVFFTKNGVKVTVTGTKDAEGSAKAESIEIDDNGKTTKAESIDKLPKEYQDLAKSALKAVK
jgi:beta-lactamase regulating signal transducer with metallopeptidase domain